MTVALDYEKSALALAEVLGANRPTVTEGRTTGRGSRSYQKGIRVSIAMYATAVAPTREEGLRELYKLLATRVTERAAWHREQAAQNLGVAERMEAVLKGVGV